MQAIDIWEIAGKHKEKWGFFCLLIEIIFSVCQMCSDKF